MTDNRTVIEKVVALARSRRFYAALAGLIVVLAKEFGLEIDQSSVESVLWVMSAWILGDSLAKT